jgi:hypothetical protein
MVYRSLLNTTELNSMTSTPEDTVEGAIEECVDVLDECIEGLGRFDAPVIAYALRTHLGGLLRAMVEAQICTRAQAREFVAALEQDALGVE